MLFRSCTRQLWPFFRGSGRRTRAPHAPIDSMLRCRLAEEGQVLTCALALMLTLHSTVPKVCQPSGESGPIMWAIRVLHRLCAFQLVLYVHATREATSKSTSDALPACYSCSCVWLMPSIPHRVTHVITHDSNLVDRAHARSSSYPCRFV